MGVKFGDIDVAQIVDNEFKVKFSLKVLDWIFSNNDIQKPSPSDLDAMKDELIEELQSKYPNSGIKYKKSK